MSLDLSKMGAVMNIMGDFIPEQLPWAVDVRFVENNGIIVHPNTESNSFFTVIEATDPLYGTIYRSKIELGDRLLVLEAKELVLEIEKEIKLAIDSLNDKYVQFIVHNQK